MEIKDMKMQDVEKRLAEIMKRRSGMSTELDEEDADIEALTQEAEQLAAEEQELEQRKAEILEAAETRRKELDEVLKNGRQIRKIKGEETMTNEEVRKSHEYNVAYAEYIKTGDDTECRALLTENVSGTVPVPEYAEDRVRTAWEREGLMRYVRTTYIKGNLKIGWESDADDAYVHTEAANQATTEEALTLGVTALVPESIKKWISISDEVRDMKGEEFLDYIYDELTYRIAKKTANRIIADVEACATTSAANKPAVAKITATTITVGLVAKAMAELSDEASNPIIVMNKKTWGAFKEAQAVNGYGYDPFEGLPVVFNNSLPAFSVATTGVTYMIVGDFGVGAHANYPNGQDINLKYDDVTKMEYDLIRILGRRYVGHGVVAPFAFTKVTH